MEILTRFLALVALYAGFHCLALSMGGWLTRFADYESPEHEMLLRRNHQTATGMTPLQP